MRFSALGLLILFPLTVAAPVMAQDGDAQAGGYPASIAGIWHGHGIIVGTEEDESFAWPMILHIYPDGAVATYPGESACAGWWEITGGDAQHVAAIEHLVVGADYCVDGLQVRVEGGDKGDLRVTWLTEEGVEDASATLTRQPDPEPAPL